jgi:hypothetical protein
MTTKWLAVFVLTFAFGCSSGVGEQCSAPAQCPFGKGFYQACTSPGGSACRLLTSDGTSYACGACGDCGAATQQAVSWCLGGGSGGTSGPDGGGSGPGGGDAGVSAPGAATLVASRPRQLVDGGAPFVAVDLILTNQGVTALPLLAPLFAISTTDGLQYRGDARTANYAGGCDPNASLTTGHSVSCTVLFSVPFNKTPNLLSYTLPDGTSVSEPLSAATTCTPCGTKCVDLQTDPQNCGGCNQVAPTGKCVDGAPACPSGLTLCGRDCVDTATSPQNCGGCGRMCITPTCNNGQCGTSVTSPMQTTCTAVCASRSLTCYLPEADYANGSCSARHGLASCDTVAPATQSDPVCGNDSFAQMVCLCA